MTTGSAPWVDGLTIGETLRRTAARYPDRDAFVFPRLDPQERPRCAKKRRRPARLSAVLVSPVRCGRRPGGESPLGAGNSKRGPRRGLGDELAQVDSAAVRDGPHRRGDGPHQPGLSHVGVVVRPQAVGCGRTVSCRLFSAVPTISEWSTRSVPELGRSRPGRVAGIRIPAAATRRFDEAGPIGRHVDVGRVLPTGDSVADADLKARESQLAAARRDQRAIHVRHDRFSERGDAGPSQLVAERVLRGKLPAILAVRPDLHSRPVLSLLRMRVGHVVLGRLRRGDDHPGRAFRSGSDA